MTTPHTGPSGTPGEVTGLESAKAYAAGMHDAYAIAASRTETFAAQLGSGGVLGGPAVQAVARAQDLTGQASTAWAQASGALDQQTVVKEAYTVAPEAGDKQFLTDGAHAGAAPPRASARAETKGHHYNPDQPRAADGKWAAAEAAAAAALPDALWASDDETCFGSDKVEGRGAATELRLMDYRGLDTDRPPGPPFVSIGPARELGDSYAEPNLSADEADQLAEDLDALAAQAEAGYAPPKPSKHARAAQRVRQMLATDRDVKAQDRIPVGYDDDTLPITYNDLLKMLDQADPNAAENPRRTVQAKTSSATGGEDGLVVMDLTAAQNGTEVVVLAMEGTTSDPDDPFWDKYRSRYTPEQTRHLAGQIRTFAAAARSRAAHSYADLQRDDDE